MILVEERIEAEAVADYKETVSSEHTREAALANSQ